MGSILQCWLGQSWLEQRVPDREGQHRWVPSGAATPSQMPSLTPELVTHMSPADKLGVPGASTTSCATIYRGLAMALPSLVTAPSWTPVSRSGCVTTPGHSRPPGSVQQNWSKATVIARAAQSLGAAVVASIAEDEARPGALSSLHPEHLDSSSG